MARKVVLTGFVSVVSPGSMLQIVVASSASLCFQAMHARCYPFKAKKANFLKLVTEVVLIFDFSIIVILRTLDTRSTLMHKDDLTKEDELLPTVLSSIMVLISAVIPLAIMLYNRRPKPQEMETPREVERS